MKNAVKQIYFLFLSLSLILILADCNIAGNVFSNNTLSAHKECSDISSHSEDFHSTYSEDEAAIHSLRMKPIKSLNFIGVLPSLNIVIKNCFITNIWQPPKFS